MKKSFQKNGAGFTLIETIIYITIFSILVVVIISFSLWLVSSNTKARTVKETLDNAERSMEIITYEINMARNIYTPTTSSNQLSLETRNYLPQGEKTSYIDFYLCDSTRLCFKKESQDPIFLTSDNVEVINLVFSRIVTGESPSIRVDLTVNYKNPTNRLEYQSSVNLISTASLRFY